MSLTSIVFSQIRWTTFESKRNAQFLMFSGEDAKHMTHLPFKKCAHARSISPFDLQHRWDPIQDTDYISTQIS